MTKASPSSSASIRRYDLDWLRTLGVLLVVPFHALLIFVMDPGSVVYMKDKIDCFACDKVAGFIDLWHMPMLFIIAGMSSAYALRKRGGGNYLLERVKRLLIPFLFGMVVLVPPMTYITQIARGRSLSFWQHYANFFSFGPDLTGVAGTWTPAHLWFIMYLTIFSLIGLPLFLLLKSKGSQSLVNGLARFFEKPMLLAVVLGFLIAAARRTEFMDDMNPIYYLFVFLFGYLIATDARYQKAIDRDWSVMLAIAVVLEILRQTGLPATVDGTAARAVRDIAMDYNRWLWTLAVLGMGHRWLTWGGKVLNYLAEAAYPFYILHFLVLTAVSYFLVRLDAGIMVKYVLIVIATFAITFMLYEGARRVKPLRFLLGMKPRPSHIQEIEKEAVSWVRV